MERFKDLPGAGRIVVAGTALAFLYALTRRYNPRPVIIRGRRIIVIIQFFPVVRHCERSEAIFYGRRLLLGQWPIAMTIWLDKTN